MTRHSTAKILLLIAITFLVLSVCLAIASLFPVHKGINQSNALSNDYLINDTFQLSPNETYRQGLGLFHGGENVSFLIQIQNPVNFTQNSAINSSIVTNNGTIYSSIIHSDSNYYFIAGANYYEAVLISNSTKADAIHFQATVRKPEVITLNSPLIETSKILFILSLAVATVLLLKTVFSNSSNFSLKKSSLLTLDEKKRQYLLVLILISLVFWIYLLAINTNPLGNFENWYTDHARDSYVSSLFFKDGFSVFSQPLNKLANPDNSLYKYVTWPQTPHLYPLGSILLFAPFGDLLQNGFNQVLIYKLEIALFLVFAHICLYFFLRHYLKKDIFWLLKGVGIYIIYVSLVVYAADGMFDSVAFIFSLFAIYMFLTERYDYFFLLVAISVFFKYQAGIFLFPLIIVGIVKLLTQNKIEILIRNKAVVAGVVFGISSVFTAYLSAPYLFSTSPQLIMNGINAFSANAQAPWIIQSSSVLLTLMITLVYSVYMLNKNSLLSLSALFLLLPIFMLPYFQNWYLPFIFVYVLIPQQKKELEVTIIWLIFLVFMLAFGGIAFNPLQIVAGLKRLIGF